MIFVNLAFKILKMALPNINPTSTAAWKKLTEHYTQIKDVSMKQMFAGDATRAENFSIQWNDFLIDYSKNIINRETLSLLQELANEVHLEAAIKSYFLGEPINQTENRAVLHTALRSPKSASVIVDGNNVMPEVFEVKNKMNRKKSLINTIIVNTNILEQTILSHD